MSSTKRVSGDYNVYADNIRLNGNLVVLGNTTSVETTNSTVTDNVITLNEGESGAGVTAGTAGIEVDRGSLTDVSLRWNESSGYWELTNDGSTFFEITSASSAVTVSGSDTYIQYNNSGVLGSEGDFRYDYTTNTLIVGNVDIGTNIISTNVTNDDLNLSPNGTGQLVVNSVVKLDEQASDPSDEAGYTHVYAKAPGTNGTGIYFVNTTTSGEVAAKNQALLLSLIL